MMQGQKSRFWEIFWPILLALLVFSCLAGCNTIDIPEPGEESEDIRLRQKSDIELRKEYVKQKEGKND